jgi:hypothetical protein
VNFSNLTIDGAITGSNVGGSISAVPEPTAIALLGVGGLILLAPVLRRRARPDAGGVRASARGHPAPRPDARPGGAPPRAAGPEARVGAAGAIR